MPSRDWLQIGGYQIEQSSTEWLVTIPFRSSASRTGAREDGEGKGKHVKQLSHDELYVSVSASTLNVHVAGQEESPLLGGELGGRIQPSKCSWRVKSAPPVGTISVEEIELRLVKDGASMWRDLLKQAYS